MRRRARHLTLLSFLNEQGTVQRSLSVFILGLDTALVLLVLVSGQVQVEALVLCLRALPQVLVLVRQLPAAEVVLHHHAPSSNNCRLLPSDCLCIGRTVSSWLSRGSLPLVP